jgi:hypothetical protein
MLAPRRAVIGVQRNDQLVSYKACAAVLACLHIVKHCLQMTPRSGDSETCSDQAAQHSLTAKQLQVVQVAPNPGCGDVKWARSCMADVCHSVSQHPSPARLGDLTAQCLQVASSAVLGSTNACCRL